MIDAIKLLTSLPRSFQKESFIKAKSSRWLGFHCILFLGISLITLLQQELQAQAVGILIYKNNTAMPNGSAKVLEYNGIRRAGEITNYFTPLGQKISLTKFQPQTCIAYPDLRSRAITDLSQLGALENGINVFRQVIATYPHASPFLTPYIQASADIIRRVKAGEVLFNGSFMSLSDYKALIKRQEDIVTDHLEAGRTKRREAEEAARRLDMETRRHKKE